MLYLLGGETRRHLFLAEIRAHASTVAAGRRDVHAGTKTPRAHLPSSA